MQTAAALLMLAALATAAEPETVPLGHKDFYPSPERPVGFRGDGNGWFPGAAPVTEWGEAGVGKDGRAVSRNIVWKVELPSWANTQPLVVGDRVFTTAEPNRLVCLDARTGGLLWTRSAKPWELIGLDPVEADQVQAMYDVWRDALPHFEKMRGTGTMSRRVPSVEFTPIADGFLGKVLPRVVVLLKELDPEGAYEEAAKVTAEAVQRYSQALAESEKTRTAGPGMKHDPINGQMDRFLDVLGKRIHERGTGPGTMRDRAKVPLDVPWGHLVGSCMSVPVSDGRHVYVSFGQGQTVCYDLNGKRVWGAWHSPNPQKDDLSGVASPLLVGNVLIDMHGGLQVIRGLDKQTGKLLWEAPVKGAGTREGGGYYVGSHKVVHLADGPKAVDVIVTTLCNIIRASDGKALGSLPYGYPPSGGPPIVGNGDIVVKGAVGDNYHAPLVAYRLKRVDDDTVEAEELWRTPRPTTPGYQSMVMSDDALVMRSSVHAVLDARNGRTLSRGLASPIAGYSNILAGHVLLWAEDGSPSWGRRDEAVLGVFGTADLSDPSNVKILSAENTLGGINKPRVPAMERRAPELYALPFYTGNAYGWPAHFLHTDTAVFPSGNRLFIRSLSHLYCIGDPTVPYDWNPASRPEAITRTLDAR